MSFDPDRVKSEVRQLQTSQPHLSFQRAWEKLQLEKPWLFDDDPSRLPSKPSVGAVGTSLQDAIAELMQDAAAKPKFVQASNEPILIRGSDYIWTRIES